MSHPQSNEAASYYWGYIDLVPGDDILGRLKSQLQDTTTFLAAISDEQSLQSYAPGKWTIRQIVGHVNDGERVFLGRALWFARGFTDELPSFDQEVCVAASAANDISWPSLREEFDNVRKATISFFENLPPDAWMRTGVASGYQFTVNALAYIIAGHVEHHKNVIADRYL